MWAVPPKGWSPSPAPTLSGGVSPGGTLGPEPRPCGVIWLTGISATFVIIGGGGHIFWQTRRQRTPHSQWQSWWQKRWSFRRSMSSFHAFSSSLSIAARSRPSSCSSFAIVSVSRANASISSTSSSFTSRIGPQSRMQMKTQCLLQIQRQIRWQRPRRPSLARIDWKRSASSARNAATASRKASGLAASLPTASPVSRSSWRCSSWVWSPMQRPSFLCVRPQEGLASAPVQAGRARRGDRTRAARGLSPQSRRLPSSVDSCSSSAALPRGRRASWRLVHLRATWRATTIPRCASPPTPSGSRPSSRSSSSGRARSRCPADGSRVAFAVTPSYRAKGEPFETLLWAGEIDGEITQLGPGTLPRFSPDGSRLAWASDDGHPGRLSLRVDGDELGEIPGSVEDISWSPDGARLLVLAADLGADRAGAQSATKIEETTRPSRTRRSSGRRSTGGGSGSSTRAAARRATRPRRA